MSRKAIFAAAGLALLAAFPLAVQNPYVLHLLIMTFLWVLLGQAWNLLGGFTGQISYGHAAFFGVGAYTTGILVKSGLSPAAAWSGLLLGGLTAALIASVIGWICFRLRGPYFSLSVLALAEVLRLAGREAGAAVAMQDALGLWEAKGNVVYAERTRGLLTELGHASLDAGRST